MRCRSALRARRAESLAAFAVLAPLIAAWPAQADEDRASLARLADIVPPAPAPWWPPAPGWLVLAVFAAALLGVASLRRFRRYRADAYRRSALAALQAIEPDASALARIAALLKRTALATAPREEVASLHGERWLQWLQSRCATAPFSPRSRELLGPGLYRGLMPAAPELQVLRDEAGAWIREHRAGA